VTGYFDDAAKMLAAVRGITTAKGIYIIPNPVDPSLLARAANRIRKATKGESTSDANIVARRWLLVDADPQRPAGISSTDVEHAAALQRADDIRRHLVARDWLEPVVADSGNGAHLLYRIDLPVDDAGVVDRCLKAIAARFDDAAVKIDTTVHNPARIWKLYGTLVCKGDNTAERPHRFSRIVSSPAAVLPVTLPLLTALAAEVPIAASSPVGDGRKTSFGAFDIDTFIAEHALELDGPEPYQGGQRWVFRRSPLCDHHGDGPFLIQFSNGALAAGCHHNSCTWSWRDLRARFDPRLPPTRGGYGFDRNTDSNSNPYAPADAGLVNFASCRTFPVASLPPAVANFIDEASTAIGCEASFVALPVLACLACAVGNSRVIQLKPTWTEPAIVWAAIVGKSGTHKSPALSAATAHLQRKQNQARVDHDEAMASYDVEKAIYERDYQLWKRSKSDSPPPTAPTEPILRRYIVSDITIEALADRLSGQFDGVLVARDELAGWLDGLAEYKGGKGSDTGHWLATWSAAPMTVDRKTGTKKTIFVPRAAVSIVGGIQPGVLRRAIGREHMQDGLCARLLLALPDPKPVRWSEAIISAGTESAMLGMYNRLLALHPDADEEGQLVPRPLPLTPEGKQLWVDRYNRHRAEQAELDDDLASAWSKLEAYTARFALLFQLCSWASQEASGDAIDETSVRAAIAVADWFGGEAQRVYGLLTESDEDRETRELVELIRRKGGRVSVRTLQQSTRRFGNAAEIEKAFQRLVKAEIAHWEIVPTTTKPRQELVLNSQPTVPTHTDSHNSRVSEESVCVGTASRASAQTNGQTMDDLNLLFDEAVEQTI
jgi:hypothetical protein